MIWKSRINIPVGNHVISLKLVDLLMYAMQKDRMNGINFYRPVICICHDNEAYVRKLFNKLYGDGVNLADIAKAEIPDPYGICWQYQITDKRGIHGICWNMYSGDS